MCIINKDIPLFHEEYQLRGRNLNVIFKNIFMNLCVMLIFRDFA